MRYVMRFMRWGAVVLGSLVWLLGQSVWAQSQSYVNSSETYSWIDASAHNRIRAYSPSYAYPGIAQPIPFARPAPPYFFYTPAGASCGTSGTNIDDRLSDPINIGFTFSFAGLGFTQVRVSTNGRIQFGTNLTCGAGTDNGGPTIYTFDYPDANMGYTMRIYGADLDSTPKSFSDAGVLTPVNPSYATVCQDDAQCYVSVATVGTAPTRKFVVTWNNVPKWVTANQIAGNFNLQIVLEEGGDFVYQYGNVVDTQANVPAQIGWQVNTNDFDIKQTALPANNSAIRYQVPRPIVQYQMEQAAWTGGAAQVLDTSGNNNHGTALGLAQTTAGGFACIGARIPANTSTGVIDAINTGVNLSNTFGGVGSATFWYKPTQWAGGGAVSAQLLDATTVNNAFFYLSKRMSGTNAILRFAVRDSSGVTQFVETGNLTNTVLSGTGWVHIGISWNFNSLTGTLQDRMRIYVNGNAIGAGGSVQKTFTTTGTPIAGIDSLYIGDNRSGVIEGALGTGNSANGVIDEFRLYNLEAGFGQILTDYNRAAACSNHYAIVHAGSATPPGNGATCAPNSVSITMHTSADEPIATSSTVTLTTSSNKGDWTLLNGYGVLTNGTADDGIATYKFNNENQVVLALRHTTAGTININVTDGAFSEKPGSEDASLTIDACTVAAFNGCEYTTARCSPAASNYDRLFTKLAGRAFRLDALTLNASGAVDTTFNKTVNVDLLANVGFTAPAGVSSCPASQTATVSLGTVTFANGRASGGPIAVSATALAAVAPNYSAYGDVRMRFTCSAANCPPSGLTVCSRDSFAVRPTDLVLVASGATPMNNTSAVSGTPKQIAGTQFQMTAQAKTFTGTDAKGYSGAPQIAATVAAQTVSAQSVASPDTLTDYTDRFKDGNVNNLALFNTANPATGSASGSFYYLDQGGFRILSNATQDTGYVSTSVDAPGLECVAGSSSNVDSGLYPEREQFGCGVSNQSNSALVGRFYPNNFLLSSSANFPVPVGFSPVTQVRQACVAGGFSYAGQPFAVENVYIYALTSGTLVSAAAMPRYTAGVVALGAENNNSGVNLSARMALNQTPAPAWASGVYVINTAGAVFSRAATPDGPFDALDIGVSVTDTTDGVTLGAARNLLPTATGACTAATCTHQKLLGTPANAVPPAPIKMRFGRLKIQNAYGSERLDLPVPMEAQYWTGITFVRNTLDTCTTLTPTQVSLVNHQGGITPLNMDATHVTAVTSMVGGLGAINLSKPSPMPTEMGSLDLLLNLGSAGATVTCPTATPANPLGASTSAPLSFLAGNWCNAPLYDRNPSARATFGVYRSPLIYRRENY